jgi:hypothetical protein
MFHAGLIVVASLLCVAILSLASLFVGIRVFWWFARVINRRRALL